MKKSRHSEEKIIAAVKQMEGGRKNTEHFRDASAHPYIFGDLYEAFVVTISDGLGGSHVDFMRYDPSGRFYLSRAYEDDLPIPARVIEPFTVLDFGLPVLRVGEIIAVGLVFARAMGCDPEKTNLSFLFEWHNLKGRALSSWANPNRAVWSSRPADRDHARGYIEVPLDMPISRLGSVTKEATNPLFDAFDAEIGDEFITDLTTRLVTRTLGR